MYWLQADAKHSSKTKRGPVSISDDRSLGPVQLRTDLRLSRRRVWRWLSSELLHRVFWYKFTDVSEMLIVLKMEAESTSETSENF
jgi:hypothetical protein